MEIACAFTTTYWSGLLHFCVPVALDYYWNHTILVIKLYLCYRKTVPLCAMRKVAQSLTSKNSILTVTNPPLILTWSLFQMSCKSLVSNMPTDPWTSYDILFMTFCFCSVFRCEGCKKIFSTASGLKRHMNKVHLTENLKFQCPTCDKRFSKTKQLRFHLAEHEGQPPLRYIFSDTFFSWITACC